MHWSVIAAYKLLEILMVELPCQSIPSNFIYLLILKYSWAGTTDLYILSSPTPVAGTRNVQQLSARVSYALIRRRE